LEEKSQADSEAVKVAQDHFHAVSAGLSSNEGGEDKTLADQIMSKSTTLLDGTHYVVKCLVQHLLEHVLNCFLCRKHCSMYM